MWVGTHIQNVMDVHTWHRYSIGWADNISPKMSPRKTSSKTFHGYSQTIVPNPNVTLNLSRPPCFTPYNTTCSIFPSIAVNKILLVLRMAANVISLPMKALFYQVMFKFLIICGFLLLVFILLKKYFFSRKMQEILQLMSMYPPIRRNICKYFIVAIFKKQNIVYKVEFLYDPFMRVSPPPFSEATTMMNLVHVLLLQAFIFMISEFGIC